MSQTRANSGKSPHAFMQEALGVQTRLRERRRALLAAALMAESKALECGSGHSADDIDRYFAQRAEQRSAQRPELRTWRK